MTKEHKAFVTEYSSSLFDEDLRYIASRLTEKLCGDLAEALDFMSKNPKMDTVLSSAESGESLFNMIDYIKDVLSKECKKRGITLRQNTVFGL